MLDESYSESYVLSRVRFHTLDLTFTKVERENEAMRISEGVRPIVIVVHAEKGR